MGSTCGWSLVLVISLGTIWLCFGLSEGFKCGKFEFPTRAGKCRPCRKCPENLDDRASRALRVDKCSDTANPTPDWLNGFYWCQGLHDPKPECKQWSPQNGQLKCVNGMQIGSRCRLICSKDYFPSLNESVECTGDLEWNKPLPYCVHVNDSITTTPTPECPEWSPDNGYISCTNSRDVGSICKLLCNQGFYPSSYQPVTCSIQLQWDGNLPFCIPEPTTTTPKQSCKPLEVVNGTVNCSEEYISGSECSVICNDGFSVSVNKTISCTDNSTWSDSLPSCVQIQAPTKSCSAIVVENGTVLCTMNFDVGTYCNVSCSEGLEISSNEQLYCRLNQTWNHSLPKCLSPAPVLNSISTNEESISIGTIIPIILGVLFLGVTVLVLTVWLLKRYRRKTNSGTKPKDNIESSGLEVSSTTTSLLNQPSDQPDEPINEDVLENCPHTRRDFTINENSASAEHLRSISYEDREKLEKYFDRKLKPNWKFIADKVLKLSNHEIDNLEYKFKGHVNTGPTQEVFKRMEEGGITLFKVISDLESERTHNNVQEALKILYRYCERNSHDLL